jgi:chromate transporter
MHDKYKLRELATVFTKLGLTAFGGPAAHIAMMQREVVQKREWMEEQRFLDMVGAVNLIPGPNSTELAIHIGHDRAGWRGLLIAGLCFILPAVFLTGTLAHFYKMYGTLPQVQPFIYGVKPAIIGIILGAVYPLARRSARSTELMIIGCIVLVLSLLAINEIFLLFAAGLAMLLLKYIRRQGTAVHSFYPMLLHGILSSASPDINQKLFFIFLKVGALLYGSGYVLFAFLDAELVSRGLLTRLQLTDAIAVGQFTPGPVFSSVTFIGYQISGWKGALVSTIGIFLPSFIFVMFLNPIIKKLRNSQLMSAFLDAVNVASVALIVSVSYSMAQESTEDWRTLLIAFSSIFISFRFRKVNSAFVVIGGAVAGYLLLLV